MTSPPVAMSDKPRPLMGCQECRPDTATHEIGGEIALGDDILKIRYKMGFWGRLSNKKIVYHFALW